MSGSAFFIDVLMLPENKSPCRVKQTLEYIRNINSKGNIQPDLNRLVSEAALGDFEAFGKLYHLYVKQIYKYVYYQVGERMTAEDITADVFTKALENINSCTGKESTFKAWLYRIAHNRVVDYFRGNKKHLSLERDIGDIRNDDDNSLEKIELLEVISKLPHNQKQVIILKFMSGLSNSEIGNIMEKSEGAVRILQMRALTTLRKKFGKEMDING